MAFFPQWLLAFRLFQRAEYGLERSTAAAHFVFRFSLLAFDSTKDIKIDVLSSYVHVLSHKHRGRCVRTNAHTEERHVTYSRISDRPLLFRELPPSATPPTRTHTHTLQSYPSHTAAHHPTYITTHRDTHKINASSKYFTLGSVANPSKQHLDMKFRNWDKFSVSSSLRNINKKPDNFTITRGKSSHTDTHQPDYPCSPIRQPNKLAKEAWPLLKERASPGNWNAKLD